MKLGIIGLGEHITRSHLPFLPTPVAFFDPEAKHDTIPQVDSVAELLTHPDIDTIMIGSPDRFHADQLLQAVQAGKHVFVEKPLAINEEGMDKVRKALKLAEEKKLVVSSCHPRRFDPPICWLKEHVDFSRLTRFVFKFLYHRVTDPWKKNRSLMLDHFGHEIDLLYFLFCDQDEGIDGPIRLLQDNHACYHVRGAIDGGAEFEFEGQRVLDEKLYLEFIEIQRGNRRTIINLNNGLMIEDGEEKQIPPKNYDVMFRLVNENFISAVAGEGTNYLTHLDLRRNNSLGIALKECERLNQTLYENISLQE
jgi:hypothetical protein